MTNIIRAEKNELSTDTNSITMQGNDNNYIEKVNNIENIDNSTNINYPMFIVDSEKVREKNTLPDIINTKYYNLIVSTEIDNDIELKSLNIKINRAVNIDYSDVEFKYDLARFNDEALAKIYSYPTIFAPEAIGYEGKTGSNQMCYLGFIKKISPTRSTVTITVNYLWKFPYKCIESLSEILSIEDMDTKITELNHTHWAVKELDLFGTLSNYGVSLIGLYSKENSDEQN